MNDTVFAATAGNHQRIDTFIKGKLREATSEAGSGIVDSATRASQLGFTNCANARYSEFLAYFRESGPLADYYRGAYPNSLFLPWAALQAVIKSLTLWVELPEHYMGAIPPEQLPWLEIFELQQNDRIRPIAQELRGLLPSCNEQALETILNYGPPTTRDMASYYKLLEYWKQAENSYFVVAPPEAFRTEVDWLSRFVQLAEDVSVAATVAPDDPLVIRFCYGGCLVVAAWGAEAEAINRMTRELNL